jgi:hypothetical protein
MMRAEPRHRQGELVEQAIGGVQRSGCTPPVPGQAFPLYPFGDVRVNRLAGVLTLSIPVALSGCMAADASRTPDPPPLGGEASELFELSPPVVIAGTPGTPVFSDIPPLLDGDRIYVADHLGGRINQYDAGGSRVTSVGAPGGGPLQFQIPYGVVADGHGKLYVNDRGNTRVQILDRGLRLLGSVRSPGQNEQILLAGSGPDPELLVQGITACPGAERCLLARYSSDGRRLAAFAPDPMTYPIATWVAALDRDLDIYLVNVTGAEILRYSRAGRRTGGFPLSSPSMHPFPIRERRRNAADLMSIMTEMREAKHTRVKSIVLSGDSLFVQLQRKNWDTPGAGEFVLDVYDRRGQLLRAGIETPGVLLQSRDGLYFARHSAQGHGRMTIQQASLRPPSRGRE